MEAKKREGRNEGGFGSSHQEKAKRVGQEYEIAERQSQKGEKRVWNKAIRIWGWYIWTLVQRGELMRQKRRKEAGGWETYKG